MMADDRPRHERNLCSLRTPHPRELATATVPLWDDLTDHYLRRAIGIAAADRTPIVCAWGAALPAHARWRRRAVLEMIPKDVALWRLGPLTRCGNPRHPLYLPGTTPFEVFVRPPNVRGCNV